MRKLIIQQWVTLDMFAATEDGGLKFMHAQDSDQPEDPSIEQFQFDFLDTVDTFLLGHNTYDLFFEYWPEMTTDREIISEKLNRMNKIIFSSTLTEAPWGKWPAARIVKQNAEDAIRTLKNQPGKDIVIWGSLQFCQSILKSGLVDEYSLTICPTLIGKGKRLFPEDFAMSNLKRLDTKNFDLGAVHIRYQVK